MIIISNLIELENSKEKIIEISKRIKNNYQINYSNIYALHKSNNKVITVIDEVNQYYTCFKEKNEDIMECCIDIEPIAYSDNTKYFESFIKKIYNYFQKKVLYFPLVYEDSSFYNLLHNNENFLKYSRLYTSIIEPQKIKDIFEYIGRNQYFSKNAVKKFERNLRVEHYIKQDVKEYIINVEKKSWKNVVGQDMYSNYEKAVYYNELIEQGIAEIAVAFCGNIPVAHRIDAVVNNSVTQLKTSFNEDYKRYKPGAYLLIYDMLNNAKQYNQIDLYGGPNLIKNLIETRRINRYDFCYGNIDVINRLKIARQKWDEKNINNFKEGKAIKKVYEGKF